MTTSIPNVFMISKSSMYFLKSKAGSASAQIVPFFAHTPASITHKAGIRYTRV
ncbi:hypothetical protein [Pedobacter sp. BS3]|uniref:hypothetical protein n=1 Tax=Pedobacter sp. BS3 TaxID=2567937 RepID=UPI001659150B|nr:hypothetical protein [Pedobacter sp. BS3]